MKNHLFLVVIIFIVLISPRNYFSQVIPDGPYFGQNPPDTIPEIFTPGIISLPDRIERVVAFSPNGRKVYYNVTNADWLPTKIWHSKFENGDWDPYVSPDEITLK